VPISRRPVPSRLAALVADGTTPPEELVGVVTAEAGALLGADLAGMVRFDDGGATAVPLAAWAAADDHPPLPERWAVEPGDVLDRVIRTRGAVWVDDWAVETGPVSEASRLLEARSTVGVPILVDGEVWGSIAIHVRSGRLAPESEGRLATLAQLLGTAMSEAAARAEAQRLADEQAALRRVALLIAREPTPDDVFALIVDELRGLLDVHDARIIRYENDDTATVVAGRGSFESAMPVGVRFPLDGRAVGARVRETGRPVRIDSVAKVRGSLGELLREGGVSSAVGAPVVVHGRVWGAMIVSTRGAGTLPDTTEERLLAFSELATAAIANSEARAEVTRLAEEQAALRRVATLVAAGAAPTDVFDAATGEVAALMGADRIALTRFEPGPGIVIVASRGPSVERMAAGLRFPLEGDSVLARVHATGRPARIDEGGWGDDGPIAALARELDVMTTVGTPIFVDGQLWGAMVVSWTAIGRVGDDAEERLTEFAALLELAVGNAESREQLIASRARVVEAGDEARRQVVRDLHDGAQQRLVHTIVSLKLARAAVGEGRAGALVDEALEHATRSNAELRELVSGLLPAVLADGGLRAGVRERVSDFDIPVSVDLPEERLDPGVEASAYFVIAEALTNVLKHARATRATVRGVLEDGALTVEVADDGVGGADPSGHGLLGIGDRVSALGGRLRVESPAGGGTVVRATLPAAPRPPGA
jgi:signal transduction histidine kinase